MCPKQNNFTFRNIRGYQQNRDIYPSLRNTVEFDGYLRKCPLDSLFMNMIQAQAVFLPPNSDA